MFITVADRNNIWGLCYSKESVWKIWDESFDVICQIFGTSLGDSKDESHIFLTDSLLEHKPFITLFNLKDKINQLNKKSNQEKYMISQNRNTMALLVCQVYLWLADICSRGVFIVFILWPCDRCFDFDWRWSIRSWIFIAMIGYFTICVLHVAWEDIRFLWNISVFYIAQ